MTYTVQMATLYSVCVWESVRKLVAVFRAGHTYIVMSINTQSINRHTIASNQSSIGINTSCDPYTVVARTCPEWWFGIDEKNE